MTPEQIKEILSDTHRDRAQEQVAAYLEERRKEMEEKHRSDPTPNNLHYSEG